MLGLVKVENIFHLKSKTHWKLKLFGWDCIKTQNVPLPKKMTLGQKEILWLWPSIMQLIWQSQQLLCTSFIQISVSRSLAYMKQFKHLTQVAGGLPLPGKNGAKIRVHFFETLYPYENVKSNKKNFHRWTKKIPAKQHSQIGPDGQNQFETWKKCIHPIHHERDGIVMLL